MKKLRLWKTIGISLLALLAIPASIVYTQAAIDQISKDMPEPSPKPAPRVTVVPVHPGTHNAVVRGFGEVRAAEELTLRTQVSGKVIWRSPLFRAGARIDSGSVLLRLDDTDYRSAVAEQKRLLAEADLELQTEQQRAEQALRDWQRSGIDEPPTDLALRKPQLAAADAAVESARIALQQAERDLKATVIRAPFDGVILSRQAGPGAYLDVTDPVAEMRADHSAEVRLALGRSQWRWLPKNTTERPALIRRSDSSEVQWQGKVDRFAAAIDKQTRLRDLVVRIDRPLDQDIPLLVGDFVHVAVEGRAIDGVLKIPASALSPEGYLWYVDDKRLQRISAEPLFSTGKHLYVRTADTRKTWLVVRNPLAAYLPGMAVQPYSDNPSPEGEAR